MKYVIFLGDGMADTPVPELDGKTPLEVAAHPNMDRMAQNGLFGLVRTVPVGMKPGSDTANLSVFGYDPAIYYSGRSPLEAASIGVDLDPDDVTYRCNFVTLSDPEHPDDSFMADYCAGEISSEEARQLVEVFNERFGSDSVHLYPGVYYRQCLVLKHAETGAELTQPHDIPNQPVRDKFPKGTNAELLNEMIRYAAKVFPNHPVNIRRVREGKNPANAVWFWGEGRRPALRPFRELFGLNGAVISAVDLIQGIGKCAGMQVLKVPGATGNYKTDFAAKGQAAIEAMKNGADYVYIHVEAPDECGHQHQVQEKVYSIEQIDGKIIGPVLDYLETCGEEFCAAVLPDHPTPLQVRTHTADPVPFALYRGACCGKNGPVRFTEQEAEKTGVFIGKGCDLIRHMLDPDL